MTESIYCIKDPDYRDIVYVGRTRRNIMVRLVGHIRQKDKSDKTLWLDDIIANGKFPIIETIETVDSTSAGTREKHWIQFHSPIFNRPCGGFRKNARRPLKYGEETEMLQFRIPVGKKSEFKKLIAPILKKWEVDTSRKPPSP